LLQENGVEVGSEFLKTWDFEDWKRDYRASELP